MNDMIDKKSKLFLLFFATIILISIIATYYRTIVIKNFDITSSEEEIDIGDSADLSALEE